MICRHCGLPIYRAGSGGKPRYWHNAKWDEVFRASQNRKLDPNHQAEPVEL